MEKEFEDLMVDLETMSLAPTAAIISIAAVEFDIETGKTGEEFYRNISLKSSMYHKLTIDADTIEFWIKQPKEASSILFDNQVGLIEALIDFKDFYNLGKYKRIWANPCSFDFPILENAYKSNGSQPPFSYKAKRDLKTLMDRADVSYSDSVNFGIPHYSLDDCKYQIELATIAWKKG